jgi:predicted dienelactone hydrolase
VKVYYPSDAIGPFPLIIFSHGLGGTREGYEYLGRGWAERGYVCVHVQHAGSDDAVWRHHDDPMASMRRAALDPSNAVNRPRDVSFAIDEALRLNGDAKSPLHGRIDASRIGVAGHSFGAYTALAIAGQSFVLPSGDKSLRDPRVKAVIAMSAPVSPRRDPEEAYSPIAVPCFHMTGTKDVSPIGDTKAESRRVPFDHMRLADQYLLTFKDGDHMVFSGRGTGRLGREHDTPYQAVVLESSTAFWNAYLKGDAEAKRWLTAGGFKERLDERGTFEVKSAQPTTRKSK